MSETASIDDFRTAMRRLAATVTLITTGNGDNRSGMAATAVMSVCAQPPTLAIAINQSASIHPVLLTETDFCVNLLSGCHRGLVPLFSGKEKGAARFENGKWMDDEAGIPYLKNASANLFCHKEGIMHIGTHTLIIGEVRKIVIAQEFDPLIWVDGDFGNLIA